MTPCNADLWVYDTAATEAGWECLPVNDNKDKDVESEGDCKSVEERSYHAMAVSGDRLYSESQSCSWSSVYHLEVPLPSTWLRKADLNRVGSHHLSEPTVHAGCPAVGRSANLDSLPITSNAALDWKNHPTAPGPGRGGTVLCPLTLDDKEVLVRYGGFAGHELGSSLDVFHVDTNEWTSIGMPNREGEEGHPLARSVHALIPVTPPVQVGGGGEGKKILALMLFGERGPAPAHLGHAGAGQFHQDAWALIRQDDLVSKENPFGFRFEELEQTGEGDAEKVPLARGWFAAGWSAVKGQGGKVVVHGGLNDQNERLGDCWVGRIEI
jgi:hypothetical protein